MVAVFTPKTYSKEQYLEMEEKSFDKHEYRNGEIVLMTGGTTNHNEIAGNLYTYLKISLKQQNCRVFIGDVRLWIPEFCQYTYPDLMVIEEKPIYEGEGTTTVTNPIIIAEVLSKSTQDYDKGTKFDYYRSIPSLKEYILIDQYHYAVQQFVKNEENKWVLGDIIGKEKSLKLASFDFKISFDDLYENVELVNT